MRNQASNSLLRILTRRAPSPGTASSSNTPQHFKLSPSTSPSPSTSSTSTKVITESFSKRALSSQIRNQTKFHVARSALAVEASSLRYVLLLSGEGEEALLRGWDAGVAIAEEDDGTWVEIMMKSCIFDSITLHLCHIPDDSTHTCHGHLRITLQSILYNHMDCLFLGCIHSYQLRGFVR